MNIFVLTAYYGTDMLNACSTSLRFIASVMYLTRGSMFSVRFDDTFDLDSILVSTSMLFL